MRRPSRTTLAAIYGPQPRRAYDPTLWLVFAVLGLSLALSYWVGP